MSELFRKKILSSHKIKQFKADIRTINFYRNNPVIACEDLLGIYLTDAQAWILASSWNTKFSVWACCRGFGKSFMIAIYAILRALLYPNQSVYIISSVGEQAKETFGVIEQIALRAKESAPDLKDIFIDEIHKPKNSDTGFKHDPVSYSFEVYNQSIVMTLNSKPDNNRGKRAGLLIYDEAAFCTSTLIEATEPFAVQDSDAKYSADTELLSRILPKTVPNQIIYASSQNDIEALFYKRYKEYAKKMLAGNLDYFVCDMPCDVPLAPTIKGRAVPPILGKDRVENALRENPEAARREYYNVPDAAGGDGQVIRWNVIRENEMQIIPYEAFKPLHKIVLAFDPARTTDNSILMAMSLVKDEKLGLTGHIINCKNFMDVTSKKKYKMDSNRQLQAIRQTILTYNGDCPDYECLDQLLIDAGAGGGGNSTYADQLLNDWVDSRGEIHRGLIDTTADVYAGYSKRYPNAVDKLRLISPVKYRTQMVEELIELMKLGVIKFPYRYMGGDVVKIRAGIDVVGVDEQGEKILEERMENYYLSDVEKVMLTQIDLAKYEAASIYKYENTTNTRVSYALAKEKANKMHDDRFYTLIMLAHRLYELRRGEVVRKKRITPFIKNKTIMPQFRKPNIMQDMF